MSKWLIWAGRMAATVFLLLVSLTFLLIGIFTPDGKALGFGVAAVSVIGGLFTWPRMPNAWRRDPPTKRQLEYASHLGISVPRGATKGQVSDLISAVTGS
jgi:membrane-bound ClpP family serine protease